MITTVTLNPAIDREYFVTKNEPMNHQYIYDEDDLKIYPGGKGLLSAVNLKKLGYHDVQNIGFIGGKQGLFFEKMVQEYNITTNYVYTENEIRNNIKIIGKEPITYTYYNDYTYKVDSHNVKELVKRFKRGIVDSKFVMISGSIPGGVDFDIYKRLIKICHDQGKKVYLQASGEALNLALQEKPEIVVPYFKHTNEILDQKVVKDGDYFRLGKKLIENGAGYVILPFHCNRLLFTEDRVFCLSPEDFCLKSWLGAGDAYNAAFFDYLYQKGLDFIEANRYGGAAALNLAEKTEVFINDRSEIEEKLPRVIIEELEG